jgi:hypothetical protein
MVVGEDPHLDDSVLKTIIVEAEKGPPARPPLRVRLIAPCAGERREQGVGH